MEFGSVGGIIIISEVRRSGANHNVKPQWRDGRHLGMCRVIYGET